MPKFHIKENRIHHGGSKSQSSFLSNFVNKLTRHCSLIFNGHIFIGLWFTAKKGKLQNLITTAVLLPYYYSGPIFLLKSTKLTQNSYTCPKYTRKPFEKSVHEKHES